MWDIFGALGRLLPGYVQGREQAIAANWQDLQNYNQTLAGQIQNAYSQATFNPAVSMFELAERGRQREDVMGNWQLALQEQMFPGQYAAAQQIAPQIPELMRWQQLAQMQQARAAASAPEWAYWGRNNFARQPAGYTQPTVVRGAQ